MTTPARRSDFPSSSENSAPVHPDLRRQRRRLVEELLLRGEARFRIALDVARQMGVSSRMVRRDINLVQRRWLRWEEGKGHRRLVLNMQRMDWAIRKAMDRTPPDYAKVAEIANSQAKLLGYGLANVFIDNRQQSVNFGTGASAGRALSDLSSLIERLEKIPPDDLRAAFARARSAALAPRPLALPSGNGGTAPNGNPPCSSETIPSS